jgi:hypothetical protein
MQETTIRFMIDLREKKVQEPAEEALPGTSLGELLYRVLFGDESMEQARVA